MTTTLIVLPLAAALVIWLLRSRPCRRRARSPRGGRGSRALGVAVAGFDFEQGLQLQDRQSWFSDLGVSYHVGFFGFSLWLAGLTIVVSTAAIGYALWVAASGAASTTGCCSSSPARSSASSPRRTCSSSTSSSRRC